MMTDTPSPKALAMTKTINIRHCHSCGDETELCCSDCAIDLGARVYVCRKKECRDYHDTKCPGTRKNAIDRAVAQERERCAKMLEQVARDDDASNIGERAADAFNNGSAHRSMTARLKDWNRVLVDAIRSGEQP